MSDVSSVISREIITHGRSNAAASAASFTYFLQLSPDRIIAQKKLITKIIAGCTHTVAFGPTRFDWTICDAVFEFTFHFVLRLRS